MIRQATSSDLSHILVIYAHARRFMAEHGNPTQWGNARPTEADISARIARNELFVLEDSDGIHGVFAFILGEDPTYHVIENGQWLSDAPYGTIHAVASDGSIHGFLTQIVMYCLQTIRHLRIDTHPDNLSMQKALTKNGYTFCGKITLCSGSEAGDPRFAYQKILN